MRCRRIPLRIGHNLHSAPSDLILFYTGYLYPSAAVWFREFVRKPVEEGLLPLRFPVPGQYLIQSLAVSVKILPDSFHCRAEAVPYYGAGLPVPEPPCLRLIGRLLHKISEALRTIGAIQIHPGIILLHPKLRSKRPERLVKGMRNIIVPNPGRRKRLKLAI